MTGKNETDGSKPGAVDLAGFTETHSSLIVVMGVFAAVAVYISQSAPELGTNTDSQLMYATGFVSALGMALLFLGLVYKELAGEVGSWRNLHYAHYRLNNLPLALFTLFNAMLVLSISYLITQYKPVIFMLVLIATLFVGGGFVLRLMYGIGRLLPQSAWVRIPVIFILSIATVFASNFVVTKYFSGIEISTIHEMSLTEPVPVAIAVAYILVVSIRAFAATGVFASILGIPVVAFNKIREKFPYDNRK
jgi:hypothetical protein